MEGLSIGKKIDILITILIAFFFAICLSFKILQFDGNFENYIMLELLMVVGLLSYYTNITLSLIITLGCDFAYMSYKLYNSIVKGDVITTNTYYWVIVLPIAALIISLLSKNVISIQERLTELTEENSNLVTIDEDTQIRNERALMMELPIYMNISTRHKIPLTLFIVRLKFAQKLKNILGKSEYKELIIQSSKVFEQCLRVEDVKYIIDDSTFAFLTITDEEGAKIVNKRFREKIEEFDFSKKSLYKNVKLDIQIGKCTLDDSIENPLDFIKLAEKELEYDIME